MVCQEIEEFLCLCRSPGAFFESLTCHCLLSLREDKKLLIFASPYIERDTNNDESVKAELMQVVLELK